MDCMVHPVGECVGTGMSVALTMGNGGDAMAYAASSHPLLPYQLCLRVASAHPSKASMVSAMPATMA